MIKDMNGVYLLINNGEIVYVGETTRDLKRIQEHARSGKIPFDNYIMFHFREASWARQFEMALICHCFPDCNHDKPKQCFLKIGEIKKFCSKIIGYQIMSHTYQNKKSISRMYLFMLGILGQHFPNWLTNDDYKKLMNKFH